MELLIRPNGHVRCLYDEALDLFRFGPPQIVRASRVEPDARGQWFADLIESHGPVLGPFSQRSAALEAEREWFQQQLFSEGGVPNVSSS